MKKNIYLSIILIVNLFIGEAFSQCTNSSAFGTATAPTNTTSLTISSCTFQSEYNTVNSVVAGNTYVSGNSCGGYITVRRGTFNGPVVASGNAPLTWTATVNGTHYIHYNTNASCGTASSCCTTTITCTSCGTPPPSGCLNTSSFGSATAPTNTTPVTISTCNYQTEYSTISNIVAGNSYQVGNSCGGYVTVRSGTYNGTVVANGNSPLTFTAPTNGTYYIHWNTNSSCGTATGCCTTTITCTSCGTPPPSGCLNTSSFGSATAPTNTTPVTISTCNYQTEYSTISNIVAGNSYQVGNSCGGYVTVRSGTYNGTVVASGNSPLTFTATTNGTYYIHWNTNSSCGTATGCCTTTITCTSCGGATCSDGIQNQGETGVDCGGPCPACPTGPNLIPTACSSITYNMTASTSITFYDDGGPGGTPCADGTVASGNYCNCNCFTTVTICAAAGQYIIADFREFAMWNTTSGWDWMRIYNGPNTGSPVMYDNSSTGANNTMGDCGIGSNVLNFCSSGQCMTFQFWATSVVNRAGWDALVSSVPGFCTPLPIELLSFTGEAVEETNVLNWTTTSEINNNYFIIETSIDAENFESVGTIEGAGNSNEVLNYQFIDNNPKAKTMYYRLKQVDFDGKWENSEIIAIERVSLGTIEIFPNPVNNMLHINFNNIENTNYTVFVTNIVGEVISETNTIGKYKLTLDIFDQLSGGVYFIKIMDESNNLIKTEKIIKQ